MVKNKKAKLSMFKSARLALDFLIMPFIFRVRKKEGGLLLFSTLYTIAVSDSTLLVIANITVFLSASLIVYSLNDFTDRYDDLNNPKKNKSFVKELINQPHVFAISHTAFIVAVLIFILAIFGWYKMSVFLLVVITNALYCKWLKGTPIFDLVIIVLCGGLYVFLATMPEYELAVTAGIMTGMPHLFQMLTDKISDAKARVKTTVVRYPHATKITTAILCFLLAFVYFIFSLPHQAIASLLPIAVTFLPFSVERQWTITRLYFTLLWVSQLYVNLY